MTFRLRELDAKDPRDRARFLRFMTEEDNAYKPSLSSRVDLGELANRVMTHGHVIAAFAGNEVTGVAAFYNNDTASRIGVFTLLGVKNAYRGQGLGQRLFAAGLEAIERAGMVKVRFQTSRDNRAIRMYREFGFKIMESPPTPLRPGRVMLEGILPARPPANRQAEQA